MKKIISFILSVTMLAGTFVTTVMAAETTAVVTMHLQSADYDINKAVLALTLSGVDADSYTYQWYNSSEENGTYSPMYKETESTYVLSSNDINTYMRCEVTPITDGVAGKVITSNSYYLSPTRGAMRFQAISRDQSAVANYKNNPSTYRVTVGGENIIILDEYDDSFYVITDGFKGWHPFGDSATYQFLPNDITNIGYYLNNDFLTSGKINSTMQPYIQNHKWWVEEACDKARVPYSFESKIALLSVTEYGKYLDRIGWGPYDATGDWWLRNSRPWTAGPNVNKVIVTSNTSRYGNTAGDATGEKSLLVRPTFYLSEDIFLEQKATVSTMGSGVKEMFVERFTTDEDMAKLKELYTSEELVNIGFELNEAFVVSDTSPAKALSQLTVRYNDDDAVSYEYQWLISDKADEGYVPAITETSEKYIVSNYDMNKYIKAQITPVYADGSKGIAVETSNYINVEKLGTMNRTDYSAVEREANKNNPTENYVNIGGEPLWILDEFYDKTQSFYVITGAKGRQPFDPDKTTGFDLSDPNNIAARLNGDFLTKGLTDTNNTLYTISSAVQPFIPTVTWWTEAGYKNSTAPSDYSVSAKIGLMSRSEYQKYWGKFGWDPDMLIKSGWWLRTARGIGGSATSVFAALGTSNEYPEESSTAWGNTWNKEANDTSIYIRPTFYLNESIFKNVKATVSSMGSEVKKMLIRRFKAEELSSLYTPAELRQIGFEVETATILSNTETTAALTTLTVDYVDENAVSYEYKWMFSDSEDGEYVTALTEKKSTYLIANHDMNKYIKAEVTPVYGDGSKGNAVETSNIIHVENLGRLSRTGYSAEEIAANQNNPTANYVNLGGEPLLILDSYSDKQESFYVMTASPKGRRVFDEDNTTKYDMSDPNNIAAFLNGEFLTKGLVDGATTNTINIELQKYIPTVTWWTEAGDKNSNSSADYSVSAKIGLMSRSEYQKYWGKFGWDHNSLIKSGWWLRTGRGIGGTAASVMAAIGTADSGKGNTWDKSADTTGFYVRPVFYLTDDAFRNIKADVNTMGEDVKTMLMERYSKKELMGIYSEDELGKIGYDMAIKIPEKAYDMYTKDEAVIEVDYVAEDMDDIIISYTNGSVSGQISTFLYPDDVYKETISLSDLPYGDNNVTVTMSNSSGTVLARIVKNMHIIPKQSEKNGDSGIVIHPAQYKANNNLFDIAAKLGFTRVRIDFPWSYIEKVKGEYDFTLFDSIVAAADEAGIELTVILCYNNLLYSDDESDKGGINTETELEGFINYVKKVAAQYPEISAYEIWNEPNHQNFWSQNVNAEEYSALVKAISAVLYGINPDCTVYAGAIDISKNPKEFIGTMFREGLYNCFDILSYHPYFSKSAEDFENNCVSVYKDILLDNGGFKSLAETEFGFNISSTDTDSETTRAREIVKASVVSDAYNSEGYVFNIAGEVYGLMSEKYAPRKLMYSMAYFNSALGDARFLGKLNTKDTTSGYVYLKNNEPAAVLWSTNSDTFSLPESAEAYDMYGNSVKVENSSLNLSLEPVYVFGLDKSYAEAAAENEKAIKTAAIKERYRGLAEFTKSAVMESDLSAEEKSTALYMLYELNKTAAVCQSVSDKSELTIPTVEYNAVDCKGNMYAEAALKLAKKYIDESNVLVNSSIADKNNIIAANNAIAKDLIETASMLSGSSVVIYDVAVNDGVLTFKIRGVRNADVLVATYSGDKLNSIEKLSPDNLMCTVGENSGKIFVWNGLKPLADSKNF